MNWIAIKALYQIYNGESVERKIKSIEEDTTIKDLIETDKFLDRTSDKILVNSRREDRFRKYYETNHLENYFKYKSFLEEYGYENNRFQERDIDNLIKLKSSLDAKEEWIVRIREQMILRKESVRRASSLFFYNDEKHLDKKDGLIDLFKKIFDVELYKDSDQQYITKLTNRDKEVIVLCENLDPLKRHILPLENKIELWWAGGNNTTKLEREDPDQPIYYSCDWDYHGLRIYSDVKKYFPEIKLLSPKFRDAQLKTVAINQNDKHFSKWRDTANPNNLSELPVNLFEGNESQIELLKLLIIKNQWIREEDMDLIEMVNER
jgi:hypothetical protein